MKKWNFWCFLSELPMKGKWLCVLMQFVLRTRPDKRFVRQGNDLLYNATITLVDALLGFSVKVICSV